MNIKKYGHCCLLIQIDELNILTDPGAWNDLPDELPRIDVVLITHEHPDHLHTQSLDKVISTNPEVRIITNKSVGKILDESNIKHELIKDQEELEIAKVALKAYYTKHAFIYSSIPQVENTAFFINRELFYPGDALFNPGEKVKILALPVSGPWLKLQEAIDYTKEVKPDHAFPVHDGMLKFLGSVHMLPEKELTAAGIKFTPMLAGDELNLP